MLSVLKWVVIIVLISLVISHMVGKRLKKFRKENYPDSE